MTLETAVTSKMLQDAFEFGTKYFQNPAKVTRGRTSSQSRGLGAIIDANIVGKVIELGVNEILKQDDDSKKFFSDMKIDSVFDFGQPDIIEIEEGGKNRPPKCFVEIKNSPKNFEWIGLYTTQFEDMKKYVRGDTENIYIIYASLVNKSQILSNDTDDVAKENERKNDLLGTFLKSKQSLGNIFNFFSDASNFSVSIDYVITGKELVEKGEVFPSGEPWVSPEIFQSGGKPYDAKGTIKNNFKLLNLPVQNDSCVLPTENINNSTQFPRQFGTLRCSGDFQVYEETKNSWRNINGIKTKMELKTLFIDCKSDVVVQGDWLGEFNLKGGQVHRIKIDVKIASKDRDDLSYPKRNIDLMIQSPISDRIRDLAQKI